MTAERRDSEGSGEVIWLRRRGHAPGYRPSGTGAPAPPPVGDLAPYERDEAPDDYRHRMFVNVLAFVFCIFLVLAGVWLFTKIAEMRKDQDCVLSGRRGCTPVDIAPRSRW